MPVTVSAVRLINQSLVLVLQCRMSITDAWFTSSSLLVEGGKGEKGLNLEYTLFLKSVGNQSPL